MPSTQRILVDTSTLFSGLGWSGPPAQVLVTITDEEFELVLTDYILDELFAHLEDFSTERKAPALSAFEYLHHADVLEESEWDGNLATAKGLVGEDKDAPIMAAFLLDGVDVLVTSNTEDFPHGDYESIMTPRGFVQTFGQSESGTDTETES